MKNLIPKKKALLFKGVFLWLLIAVGGFSLNAQVSTYAFSQSSGTFNAMTGGTVLGVATGNTTTTNLNSNVYPITLPFGFIFNGQNYSSLNVSTNGFITFGATAPTSTDTTPISGTAAYDGAVSAFGRDISSFFDIAGKTGDIRWEVVGTAPNREVVIQWTNFRPTTLTTITTVYSFSFQIRLQETTNSVSVVYGPGSYLVGSTTYSAAVNQVGLRGLTNADFNNRYNPTTEKYTSSVAGDANGDDQAFNTVNAIPGMPSDGLTYAWTPPTCYPPLAPFNYSAFTINSASISWTAPAIAPPNGYDVYYSTGNTAPTTSTVLDASNSVSVPAGVTTANISGLTPSTQYFVWIRSKCSSTDASSWASAGYFGTSCNPVTVPYSENFDTTPVGTAADNNAPVCWRYTEPAGWPGYGYVSANNSSAPNGYYLYSTNTTGGGMLVSPQTTNLMNGMNRVRFKASGGAANYNLEVGTVSDPSDAATFTALGNAITLGATTTWAEYIVYIPAGTNQYLAFRHPGQTATATSLRLDDIFVEVAPTCIEPSDFSVIGGTLNSISLMWTAPNVSTPISYTIYYSTVNTAPTASTVLDTTNSLTVTGLSGTVPNLTPATTYYFWIRSNCAGSDLSVWSNPVVTGYTGYCIPATGATTTRYVETLTTTGGMTNLNYSAGTYAPYVDQSATSFSTYPSGTIDYSIDASTTSSTYYYIWVDWNNDMDFEDAGEKVLGSATVANITGSFTIPSTTALGSYRVRVAAATVGTIGACGTPANGNYVDFTLVVAAPSGCIAPSNLTAANETFNSAAVSWNASVTPPANGYEVYYSTSATPPTASTVLDANNSVTAPAGTTVATISALTPVTKYYFWVRSVCSGTSTSDWTLVNGSFSTLCQPPAITGTTGATVCNSTATLSATADSGATINWYADATATTPLATGASYTTPVLNSTTNYYVSASTGSTQTAALANATSTSGYTLEAGQFFDALTNILIEGVYVYPIGTGAGTVTIALQDGNVSPAVTLQTITVNLTGTASPGIKTFVPLNFNVPAGTGYKLMMMNRAGLVASLVRESGSSWGTYPLTTTGVVSITNGNCCSGNTTSTSYYYFYDWQVSTKCESARTPVTATVDCTMGTSEADLANAVVIYPNPFTDMLHISDVKGVKSISILDLSGRVVKSIDKPSAQINLSELKSGMYLISLQYKDGSVHTMKAIKK